MFISTLARVWVCIFASLDKYTDTHLCVCVLDGSMLMSSWTLLQPGRISDPTLRPTQMLGLIRGLLPLLPAAWSLSC